MTRLQSIVLAVFCLLIYVQAGASEHHIPGACENYLNELDSTKNSDLIEVSDFGSNPGNLKMYKFVPEPEPENAPLIVALHGTSESPQQYSENIGWNRLAQKHGFIVLYPAQTKTNNATLAFRWFSPEDTRRDMGESGSVKQMIDNIRKNHSVDDRRIFVTGFSAGASFATVLCCNYPELFAAGAIMAGTPFRSASSLQEGFIAMFKGISNPAEEWAKLVHDQQPGYTGRYPALIIFHGDEDRTVKQSNMHEIVKQFTEIHATDQEADHTGIIKRHRYSAFHDAYGRTVVETWQIKGMGHKYAVDPGNESDQGGKTGTFASSAGLYSAYYSLISWKLIEQMR